MSLGSQLKLLKFNFEENELDLICMGSDYSALARERKYQLEVFGVGSNRLSG